MLCFLLIDRGSSCRYNPFVSKWSYQKGPLADSLPAPVRFSAPVQKLRAFLEDSGIAAGSRLPAERQLAELLHIGRPALREAIHALAILGILESRRGAGTYLKAAGMASPVAPAKRPAESVHELSQVTKVDQVRRAILEGIFAGAFRPGDRLVESVLAARFGVSQGTVNQALQDLHVQGAVTKSLNRETTVSRFGLVELESFFPLRLELESMAAAVASRRRTPEALQALRRHVDHMRRAARAADVPEFLRADFEFHQELYRTTRSRFLLHACEAVATAPFINLLCEKMEGPPPDYLRTAQEHDEIIDALQQDPETAASFVRSKVAEWNAAAIRALTTTTGTDARY
jgi:DNA-binding GntR family transcriptional regulator